MYVSIIMSEDAAPAVLKEFGKLGCLQLTDMEPSLTPFQRRYVDKVKLCDEIERKLRYIHGEVQKMEVDIKPAGEIDDFVDREPDFEDSRGANMLDRLDAKLRTFEEQLLDLNKFSLQLLDEFRSKVEYHEVLVKCRTVFGHTVDRIESKGGDSSGLEMVGLALGISAAPNQYGSSSGRGRSGSEDALMGESRSDTRTLDWEERGSSLSTLEFASELTFSNITGVLSISDRARFERMVFRSTRGNCFVRFSDMLSRVGSEPEFAGECLV